MFLYIQLKVELVDLKARYSVIRIEEIKTNKGVILCQLSMIIYNMYIIIIVSCVYMYMKITMYNVFIDDLILFFSSNPYKSVDPAPPSLVLDTETLQSTLLDESRSLFDRYRYSDHPVFLVHVHIVMNCGLIIFHSYFNYW